MDSLCDNSLCESPRIDDVSMEELIPKKVRFREEDIFLKETMVLEPSTEPKPSWKDKLIGSSSGESRQPDDDDDIEVLDGDIHTSNINGTPSILFFRIEFFRF